VSSNAVAESIAAAIDDGSPASARKSAFRLALAAYS